MIPLRKVKLATAENIIKYIKQIDCNKHYSNFGPLHEQLTARFAEKFGCSRENIILVSSGWAGLVVSLNAYKSYYSGSHKFACMIPNYTFPATTAAAISCALDPVFIDVDKNSWQMSEKAVLNTLEEKKCETLFAIPVSPFGATVNIKFWEHLKTQYNIEVVVDAAWSFDKLQISKMPSIISLHATKAFGIGEGGIVISNDKELISDIKQRCNFGLSSKGITESFGSNFKLSEYSCAVGLANLDQWPEKRKKIIKIRKKYDEFFSNKDAFQLTPNMPEQFAPGAYALRMLSHSVKDFQIHLAKCGVQTRRWWAPDQDQHSYFKSFAPTGTKFSREMSESCVNIPFYEDLSPTEQNQILECIDNFLAKKRGY